MSQRRKTRNGKEYCVFGFDELEKAMKQCEKNYPSQADAFLMAEGRAINKRTKITYTGKDKKTTQLMENEKSETV